MEFTYQGYQKLLKLLSSHGYEFASYHNYTEKTKPVILRHDIDNDIKKALKFAELEYEMGARSTYFVLLTSDFYNIFSKNSREMLCKIQEMGHEIGLHFDEVSYPELIGKTEAIIQKIKEESEILSQVTGKKVQTVSMHRPSKGILDADLKIGNGIINSYGKTFFSEFKYLSDSRRNWREPVEEIVASEKFEKLHILTHAFWYQDTSEDLKETVEKFINSGNMFRYECMEDNITDLNSIMKKTEVIKNYN